jgi:hypothetical protein
MVQLQESISECLHHHTLFNMLFDGILKTHYAQILSYSGLKLDVWFIVRPIFLAFQLLSLNFSTTLHMWLGLFHPSIVNILWCVCTHPMKLMGIHLLRCVHKNERIRTHDAISWHLCHHCARCWLPRGMIIITCTSFNHFQLLSLISQHYVY